MELVEQKALHMVNYSFDDEGFTVRTGTSNDIWVNDSGKTYVAWSWKAGGNKHL